MIDCHVVSPGSRALSYFSHTIHVKGGMNTPPVRPTGVPYQPGFLRPHPQRQNHVWLLVEGSIGYTGPTGNTSGAYELFNLRGNP